MADEPLTEAEIAVLLGKPAKAGLDAPTAPERLLAQMSQIHDAAARHFGAELSAMLRRTARVRMAKVQSLSESEFCARAELPSFLRRFAVSPFQSHWMLEIRPGALFPIIDCLLGGGREKTPIARRPLTEIESRLATRIARAWIASLQAAWRPTVPLEFSQDFEPLKASVAGNTEILAISFDIELAGSQGSMHLAIPLVELGAICSPSDAGQSCAESAPRTCLAVELRPVPIEGDELASLDVGDVIVTEHRAEEEVIVTQDGVPRFAAKLGAWQGQKAVEIQRELTDETQPPPPPADGQ